MDNIYERIRADYKLNGSRGLLYKVRGEIDYSILLNDEPDFLIIRNVFLVAHIDEPLFLYTNQKDFAKEFYHIFKNRNYNHALSDFFYSLHLRIESYGVSEIFKEIEKLFNEDTFDLHDLDLFFSCAGIDKFKIDFFNRLLYKSLIDNMRNINIEHMNLFKLYGIEGLNTIFENINQYSKDELFILMNIIYAKLTGNYIDQNSANSFNMLKQLDLSMAQIFSLMLQKDNGVDLLDIDFA